MAEINNNDEDENRNDDLDTFLSLFAVPNNNDDNINNLLLSHERSIHNSDLTLSSLIDDLENLELPSEDVVTEDNCFEEIENHVTSVGNNNRNSRTNFDNQINHHNSNRRSYFDNYVVGDNNDDDSIRDAVLYYEIENDDDEISLDEQQQPRQENHSRTSRNFWNHFLYNTIWTFSSIRTVNNNSSTRNSNDQDDVRSRHLNCSHNGIAFFGYYNRDRRIERYQQQHDPHSRENHSRASSRAASYASVEYRHGFNHTESFHRRQQRNRSIPRRYRHLFHLNHHNRIHHLGRNSDHYRLHLEMLNSSCCEYYLDRYYHHILDELRFLDDDFILPTFRRGGLRKICCRCYTETMSRHTDNVLNTNSGISSAAASSVQLPFQASYESWKKWAKLEQEEYTKHRGRSNRGVCIHRNDSVIATEFFQIKRIMACIGWAVHGLILELVDGTTRTGYVNGVSSIYDEEGVKRRHPTLWVDIEEGDYVVAISGYDLARNCFMCHSLTFEMASGRTIEFASKHEPWRGEPFRFELPEAALLHHISFSEGKCVGLSAAESHSHMPITAGRVMTHLSPAHQKTFQTIQLCFQRIDRTRMENKDKPLGRDLWSNILWEYLRCADLLDYMSSPLGRVKEIRQK